MGNWLIASFRPGDNPFQALSRVLIPFLYTDELERISKVKQLTEQLHNGEIAVSDVIKRILEKDGKAKKFLLFADQFEELYTLCHDEKERRQFIDELLRVSGVQTLVCVLTMRADFWGKAISYRPFADVLQNATLILSSMNREELRETIENPAKMLDVDIEEGLADRILDAVSDEPGNLPLLEFALTELWKRQEIPPGPPLGKGGMYKMLTHAAYDEIGGVERALTSYAESVYESLNAQEKERARHIFVQLVRPGEGTEDIRRVAHCADVGEENWELVTKLADARLVVTGGSEDRSANFNLPEETVEVVHEAMIRGWQRLREWVEADREFRTWQERLRFAMRQWVTSNHDEGALLRGAPLAEAEQWLEQRHNDLNQDEQHFIEASVQLRDKEVRARRKLRQRITTGLVASLIIAVALASFAVFQWNESEKQRQRAEQQTEIAISRQQEAEEQRQITEQIAKQQTELVAELARKNLLRNSEFSELENLNLTSKALFLFAHDDLGALLASLKAGRMSQQKHVPTFLKQQTIFNLGTVVDGVHEINRLEGHKSVIGNVIFSPDGTLLASGSWDSTIKLWNVADGREIRTLHGHSDVVTSVTFSPDGTLLASGGGRGSDTEKYGEIKLWRVANGREIRTLHGHSGVVTSVTFSPDGTLLASGSWDSTIKLWNVADGREIRTLHGHSDVVTSVTFSPDGTLLASGGGEFEKYGEIKLWNVANGREIATLQGHSDTVSRVMFSPDGTLLASGSEDKTIKLWKVADGREITTLRGHAGWVGSVTFSPDGTLLASGSGDKTIKLWKVADGREITTLQGHFDTVSRVTFSPDGTLLASGSEDKTIKLWNVADGRGIKTLQGHSDSIRSVAFGPDGTLLAVSQNYFDKTLKLWKVADGQELMTLKGHTDTVNSGACSSDGRLLASGSQDGIIKLWNIDDGREITTLRGHAGWVVGVAFSPDSRLLASGGRDKTIKLWNLDLDLDDLLVRGCEWLHGYLKNNPNISEEDRALCDDILENYKD